MKKITCSSLLIVAALTLTGCQTTSPAVQKTSLEIQAIQAKMFGSNLDITFKSVVSVLQDLGYIIQTASKDTGLITAQSPTVEDNSGGAVFAAIFGGVRSEGSTSVTASVEEFNPKQTRVRLNFVSKSFQSSAYGRQSTNETPIQDPKIYENAFAKIGDAIFIRTSQN